MFFVRGTHDDYPDIDVSQDISGRYNLTIISNEDEYADGGFSVYVREEGVRFGVLRIVTPDNEPLHDVTLTIAGDYPVQSIDELGAIIGGSYHLSARITLNPGRGSGLEVAEDIGTMVVNQTIFDFQIGGNLGSLATAGSPVTVVDHISNFEVQGNLLGELLVSDDVAGQSIGSLVVWGRLGYNNPTTADQLAAGNIRTAGSIGSLQVGEVGPGADIEVGITMSGTAPIGFFEVSDGFDHANSTGKFRGTLTASTIDGALIVDQVNVTGDFSGEMTFDDVVTDDDVNTPALLVEGDFESTALITLPADGLEGHFVLNGGDTGAVWASGAEVVVGAATLTSASYATEAVDIGGGAVGLAGFGLHFQSCDPPTTSGVPAEMTLTGELIMDPEDFSWDCVFPKPSVYIQFYGQVGRETGTSGLPVIVERFNGISWGELTGFTYDIAPGGEHKQIKLTPTGNWGDGSYRIRRRADHLYCRSVGTDDSDVANFTYYLDVYKIGCGGSLLAGFDLNSDENVSEPGDMPAWLIDPVDFNDDSATDATDLQILEGAAALFEETAEEPVYYTGPWEVVE